MKTPWFTNEVKILTISQLKKEAYLKFKSTKTPSDYIKYKETRNRTNARIRQIKKEFWERFTKDLEHGITGAQNKVWKMIRNRRKDINKNYTTTKISAEDWYKHFKNMYDQIPTGDELTGRQTEENTIRIETEDIMKALKNLRGRKTRIGWYTK